MNFYQKYFTYSIFFFSILWLPVAIASHTLNPSCANVVLDPTGFGGSTETFDACLLTGDNTPQVGVILLHGRTSSPDGPVVNELRKSLQRTGYTTLSIENPAANATEDTRDFNSYISDANSNSAYAFPEVYARVLTAIDHLKGITGIQRIVIVGFSMGSRFASAAVARVSSPTLPIIGLVGIGMYNTSNIDPLDHDFTLDEITVPVIDIYGDLDNNAVNDSAGRVNNYNKGTGISYTQVVLKCSEVSSTNCHQLDNLKGNDSMPLEITVNNWMACNAPLGSADCSNTAATTSDDSSNINNKDSGSSGGLNIWILLSFIVLTLIRWRKYYKVSHN